MGTDDYNAQPETRRSGKNARSNAVFLKKKNGTDVNQCRSRPRILRVLAVFPRLLQCRRLVNIFEMVPPVQRMQSTRHRSTLTAFHRQASFASLGRGQSQTNKAGEPDTAVVSHPLDGGQSQPNSRTFAQFASVSHPLAGGIPK